MNLINLSPPASSLIESIRSIGYSFDTAVADIIDNSISAESKKIKINTRYDVNNGLTLEVVDDGIGMSQESLRQAMSLGGKGPSFERQSNDLGRFGLGLKTASFSQALVLTVVTKFNQDESIHGIKWDLNKVVSNNKWDAFELSEEDCFSLIKESNVILDGGGTIVQWKNCDRIKQNLKDVMDLSEHVQSLVEDLKKKLSLVFHKYLENSKIAIYVNGSSLKPMDPFALRGGEDTAHSQRLFSEKRIIENSTVEITGYLLPHISRMGGQKRENQISIDGEHTAYQGLYIYRLDRLIIYGGWHQIIRKTEANKLARIEISISNEADHIWQLDIKKATAILPVALRSRLRDLIRGVSRKSNEIFMRRVRMKKSNPSSVWERIYDKEKNSISYVIDQNHPIIQNLINSLDTQNEHVLDLIGFIEKTLPVDFISNDLIAGDGLISKSSEDIYSELDDLSNIVANAGVGFSIFKSSVIGCGLYKLNLNEIDEILEKFKQRFKI
jgi:hypothetical protein